MPRFVSEPFPCETYRGISPIGLLGRSAPARIHLAGALFCFRCRESSVRQRAAGSLRRGTAGAELPVCGNYTQLCGVAQRGSEGALWDICENPPFRAVAKPSNLPFRANIDIFNLPFRADLC